MNFGLTAALNCIIAVGIAVGVDALLYKTASDSPLNTMSAAVFGMIVALSYSLGVPVVGSVEGSIMPLVAPECFMYRRINFTHRHGSIQETSRLSRQKIR